MNINDNYQLDIVILSYNVCDQLKECLNSILNDPSSKNWKIWVIDNASTDQSVEMIKTNFSQIKLVESPVNVGFSAGNNLIKNRVSGDYILFLNPDTIIPIGTIDEVFKKLRTDLTIGAITCRVELANGKLDDGCHRGFPTPWNSFCHFTGLSQLFPSIKFFSGYQMSYLDIATEHEIDSLTGAFMMLNRKIADQVGWWDEDYFWNGEDLDFCFRIKKAGYKIIYYPFVKIIHYKGSSAGYKKNSNGINKVSLDVKLMAAKSSTKAMQIFYEKHYKDKYPQFIWKLIILGIKLLEKKRVNYVINNENRH